MFESLLFERLQGAERVLLAGAGGGFDAFGLDVWLDQDVAAIRPSTPSAFDDYFPERALARWLERNDLPPVVYAFPKTGVQPLRAAYRRLIRHLRADAVILVDGRTDLLLRGDESGLGTPEEDMVSLAALHGIEGPVKLAASLGARNLYLDRIEDTVLIRQVALAIEEFRHELPATRKPRIIPH